MFLVTLSCVPWQSLARWLFTLPVASGMVTRLCARVLVVRLSLTWWVLLVGTLWFDMVPLLPNVSRWKILLPVSWLLAVETLG